MFGKTYQYIISMIEEIKYFQVLTLHCPVSPDKITI